MELIEIIRAASYPLGLNLVAAMPVERYDSLVPEKYRAREIYREAATLAVIGNGGGAFWSALKRHAAEHRGWMDRDNPLDDFTRLVVEREIVPRLTGASAQHKVIYPFMSAGPTLNFMEAAKAVGLSAPSILGVVIHPAYGPWIAFRAAILLHERIEAPGEAFGFDPCPSCTARTCMSACPVGAVSFPAGWDIPKCLTHRVEMETDCAPRCHARAACVIGPEHRYPDDELAYHQMRALRAMRPYYETHIKSR